jgi:hypothetical protein
MFKSVPFSKNNNKSLKSIYTYCCLNRNFFKVVCVRNKTLTFKGCLQILLKLQAVGEYSLYVILSINV